MSGTKPQEEEEQEFGSRGFSRIASARSVTTERGLKKHREPWEREATKESAGLGRESPGLGRGFPKSPRLEAGRGPRASLKVAVALALDGFLDAQQHRGEPLIQPRDGVEFLHCLSVCLTVLLLVGFQQFFQ